MRVVVVDNDPRTRRTLAEFLTSLGHEVCLAVSGLHALEQMKEFYAELVIAALQMPGKMDGKGLLEHIRTDGEDADPNLLFVLMTRDMSSAEDMGLGDDDHVLIAKKPSTLTDLQAIFKRVSEIPLSL